MNKATILISFCFFCVVNFASAIQLSQIPGLSSGRVLSMVAGPNGDLFAGTYGGGIYKSTDKGLIWSYSSKGIGYKSISALAVDSTGKIYAGTSGAIFVSSDNGGNWNIFYDNNITKIYDIACSADYLFFATQSGLGRISLATQDYSNAKDIGNITISRIIIDNYGRVFANGTKINGDGGFYVSSNGGSNWLFADEGLKNTVAGTTVYYDVSSLCQLDSNNFYAATTKGIYASSDMGFSWTLLDNSLKNEKFKFITPFTDSYLIGTADGLFTTTNFKEFVPVDNYIGGTNGFINAGDDYFVFTGKSAIMHTSDGGLLWDNRFHGISAGIITSYAIGNDNNIAAVTDNQQIFYFINGFWTKLSGDEKTDNLINGVEIIDNENIIAITSVGCVKSDLSGNSSLASNGIPDSLKNIKSIFKAPNGNLIISNEQGNLFFSSDHGGNWTPAAGDTLTSYVTSGYTSDDGTIYLGSNKGEIVTSTDNGGTWTYLTVPSKEPWFHSSLQAILKIGATIYVTSTSDFSFRGLFHSEDNGANWQKEIDGINLYSLISYKSILYSTTSDHLVSIDNSYQTINEGDSINFPSQLKTIGTKLFAASQGSGVMMYNPDLGVNDMGGSPTEIKIMADGSNINVFDLPAGTFNYKIFDLIGNIAGEGQVNGSLDNPVKINSGLSSGKVFFIRFKSGDKNYWGKFITK